jgi:extracellular factor (EF) 3-hydroxypalmitic acid methyl ester biosynthesis protein
VKHSRERDCLSESDEPCISPPKMHLFSTTKSYIEALVARGGPSEADDAGFNECLERLRPFVADARQTVSKQDVRSWFGDALSDATVQGLSLRKQRGYPADYEVLDLIYTRHVGSDTRLSNWDRFYQRQAAPMAVRNRMEYFHRLLDRHSRQRRPLHVLKLAHGPGRCAFEWFTRNPDAEVFVDSVDSDEEATEYASVLNRPFLDRITFVQSKILRFQPKKQYDLIWAPGVFDSFNDGLFIAMMMRLLPSLLPGGELVIGNFSDRDPSRAYMELVGDWNIHHRSAEHLCRLAREVGVDDDRFRVGSEPEGVDLFLHVASQQP